MSIVVIQAVDVITCPGVTAGSFLGLVVTWNPGAITLDAIAGATRAAGSAAVSADVGNIEMFYVPSAGAGDFTINPTWSTPPANPGYAILELTGGEFDVANKATGTSTAPQASINPSANGSLLLGMLVSEDSGSTSPSGWATGLKRTPYWYNHVSLDEGQNSGSQTPAWTTSNVHWATSIMAVKPTGGGGGGKPWLYYDRIQKGF